MNAVVLIGASTAAPQLHERYLARVPVGFRAPIIVVQHMPPGPFMDGLLRRLRATAGCPVELCRTSMPLRPGAAYFVAPGTTLTFERCGTPRVIRQPPGARITPRMDLTFSSAAQTVGARACVVMTSGLHANIDGLAGCRAVRRAGGRVAVTTPATTPCYSMVRQVREAGAFDDEVDLERSLEWAAACLGGER